VDVRIVERYVADSDALKEYTHKKVEALSRYFDKIVSLDVVMDVERGRHLVEIVGHLVNRKTVKAEANTEDMYASIDEAVDKLQRQLVRYKERLRVERKANPRDGQAEAPARGDDEPSGRRIVEVDSYTRKPMTPEEAVLELEASNKEFVVFFHLEDDNPAVVFKRGGGEYGLIRPRRR